MSDRNPLLVRECHSVIGCGVWFCLIAVVCGFAHQRHFDAPTPVSRLDLLRAIVIECEFAIDNYAHNTPDKAQSNNHYYSDKAPGTVMIFLPLYWVVERCFNQAGNHNLKSKQSWLYPSWITCAGTLGLLLRWVAVCFTCIWQDGGRAGWP